MRNRVWNACDLRKSANAVLGVLSLALFFGGCTTEPKKAKYLFYPTPPDQPRLQYLTGFTSEKEIFSQSGFDKFVLGTSTGDKGVGKPYGIGTRPKEVFISDSGFSGVGILDLEKKRFEQFIPSKDGKMQTPINAAYDSKGNLYVTDTEREQVLIYGPDREPLEPLGKKGEMKPCGIAIAGEKLYITDLMNHQVRIYQLPDRKQVATIPRADDGGKGKLYSPVNVIVDHQGKIYVADPGSFCVQVYDPEGKHVRTLGRQGIAPGAFARPRGIAVDREGRVYVVDAGTQVVQVFDSEGRLLIFFGDPTITGPGSTSLPAGIAVDYDNVRYFEKFAAPGKQIEYLIFLTNQYGNPRVSVYGFLKQP